MDKKSIDSKTKLFGLIGNPIKQSFSPYIHNFMFEFYGLNYIYTAFDIEYPIDNSINGIKGLGLKGLNVTAPYKEEIIKHLDWISQRAKGLAAVNTVKNINGELYGFNTDFFGIVKAFKTNNVELKGKSALILGSGKVAKTMAFALKYLDIQNIVILNRTPEKARSIFKNIQKRRNSFNYGELNNNNVNAEISNVDIIINTTSIDILANKEYYIDWKRVQKKTVFFDVLYNPATKLITMADYVGFKTITGLDMLIWQAMKSFQIWTGIYPEKDKYMYSLLVEHIKK